MKRIVFAAVVVGVLVGCQVTGPADDGWETSEGFKRGPGLISGEDGVFDPAGGGRSQERVTQEIPAAPSSEVEYNSDAPTDYDSYQRWREAKDKNSREYERFRRWQEYEEFLKWKENQK